MPRLSAAAEKLYVTQPSISAAVSALSRELGVDLTERVGRGIGLTSAGEAFRPYAADVLGLIEQGRQAAREAADVSMRSLRIVAVATAAEFVVPALLRAFNRLHPEINLALEVANRASLFERVLEHDADVAIAGRPPEDERIAGVAFMPNELALIVAPTDPLAGSGPVVAAPIDQPSPCVLARPIALPPQAEYGITDCYIKPYACCRHIQPAVEAMFGLCNDEKIAFEDIKKVDVETYKIATEHAHVPWDDFASAQLSFPYLMGLATRYRGVRFEHFDDKTRNDPAFAEAAVHAFRDITRGH